MQHEIQHKIKESLKTSDSKIRITGLEPARSPTGT